MARKSVLVGLALVLAVTASGCFLKFALAARTVETLSDEINLIIDALFADATVGVCRTNASGETDCTYVLNGEEIGTSARFLSEFGLLGVVIDPLVIEVPAGAVVSGTFSGGGQSGTLVIYPRLSFVPIDDNRTLTPAAGKELAIVDLPSTAPVDNVDYAFNLSIRHIEPRNSGPTQIKALLTARIRVGPKTFYPPLFPCVSSLAAAPTLQLASSATAQPITVLGAATPCSGEFYTYFRLPQACDLDNDRDVDANDVGLIMNVRNTAAASGDPRDVNTDAVINANDARFCTARCSRPRCGV
jgi:hypothetical protein